MNTKNATGNTRIREEHKTEILNYIRKFGPVSRTEIYEKTNISKPTVTRVIEELNGEGLIRETGMGEASVGRRPVNIELNPSACYVVGVNVSKNTLSASLVDLGMNVTHKKSLSIKGMNDTRVFQETMSGIIRELMDESKVSIKKILGIGVGLPGLVDYSEGVILDFAITHNFMNVHLKDYLEQTFELPVRIDNNANTRVLGEYWYGYGAGYKDIIFIICSEGIGSGIITGGNIVRGKNNIASELGHMTVNIEGKKCRCGGYGCVETYCSTEALESMVKEALRRGRKSSVAEECKDDVEELDYKMICRCAEEGDLLSRQIMEEAACVLGTGIANLVGIFNPELIILSGNLFDASPLFYDMVTEITRQKIYSSLLEDVVFTKRKVQDSLYEIGAATMVFKEFFKD